MTKRTKTLSGAVLISLFLAGCSWFQGGTGGPSATEQKDPQEVLRNMASAMEDVSTFHMNAELSIQAESEADEMSVMVRLFMDGDFDNSDQENPSSQMNLRFTLESDDPDQGPMGASAEGDVVMMGSDDTLYARLNDVSIEGEDAAETEAMVESFIGKWYMFPLEDGAGPLGGFSPDLAETLSSGSDMTPEQREQLEQLIRETDFFKVVRERGETTMNGVTVMQYTVELNKEETENFVIEAARISENPLTEEEIQDLKDGLAGMNFTGDVFVGASDGYLYQLNGILSFDGALAGEGSEGQANVSINIKFSEFNEDVNIEAPEGAQEFNLFEGLDIPEIPADAFPTDFPTGLPTGMPTGFPSGFPTNFPTGFPQ